MNVSLQEAKFLVKEMHHKITAFDCKIRMWELQLRGSNMTQFPSLRKPGPIDAKIYEELHIYRHNTTPSLLNLLCMMTHFDTILPFSGPVFSC
jgi:hypothetical protein